MKISVLLRDHALPWLRDQCAGSNRTRLLLFAAFALFLVYGSFRQRYIWGVDAYGYYEEGRLFSQGQIHLPLIMESKVPGPLVPWGFKGDPTGRAVPEYPPGYPLLLAVGHLLRMPLWVNAFIGVASCALLYGLLRDRAAPAGTALAFTFAWAFMPLTVYGSTMLMSDLVAASTIMAGLLAFRRERFALAGWMFGLSIAVRPTNVLFFVALAVLFRFERRWWRLALHLILPCALYATYNTLIYGAPWRTGYGNVVQNLSPEIVPAYLSFYLKTTWTMITPVIVLLALVALRDWSREKLSLLLWLFVFMVFYAFWRGGGIDRWWWSRFVLPGFPALFLLAADGFERCRLGLGRWRWGPTWGTAVLFIAVLVLPFYYVWFGRSHHDLWLRTTGDINHHIVTDVAARVPAGSLVGSAEHASTFRLYTPLISFIPVHAKAPDLIAEALGSGRKVYFMPEPWNLEHEAVVETFQRFQAVELASYEVPWPGLKLYELRPR